MARDYLTTAQKANLGNETVYTTIKIELANATVLRLASADLTIDGQAYSGTIKPTEALRMGLTRKADKFSFEIFNADLVFGRAVIADSDYFTGSFAVLGAYHKNSSGAWHDEKVSGEIVSSEVDGDSVYCKFLAITDAAKYTGIAINSVFKGLPPLAENPLPVIDEAIIDRPILGGKMDMFLDDPSYGRRYFPFERENFLM